MSRARGSKALLAPALGACVALGACGREGPPLPPVLRVAEQTRDLAVVQEGESAVLRWSYPAMTSAGEPLEDVEGVELWRATLPVAQEPAGGTARDEATRRRLLEAQGERISTLDRAGLAGATRGNSLQVRDDLVSWRRDHPGEDDAEQVVWYALRTVCCGGRASSYSNIARLVPSLPPAPPSGLAATTTAEGVELAWQAPAGARVEVERSLDGRRWESVTGSPLTGASWRDQGAAQGGTLHYRLRSVRAGDGGTLVRSVPSEAIAVAYPDVYPPPEPEELVCLPEGARVLLRWVAPPTAERYRVSRIDAGGAENELTTGLGQTSYVDPQPPAGSVTYTVRARDAAGNESPPASCTTIVAPLR